MDWIGYIVRIDQGRTVTKILERKLDGSRRKGRPRLRWLEDVEKDLWEKKWQQKAADREAWAFVIKGARDLRGRGEAKE
jgi:hypothetical protein